MDRTGYINIGGKRYPMRFSLGALQRINDKFGSYKQMADTLSDDSTSFETIAEVLEILISQGCAYKNLFEADLPIPEDAPIKDGKYVPPTAETIQIGIDAYALQTEIMPELLKTFKGANVQQVATKKSKKTSKNSETM